jgi:hypothetical protein
VGSRTGRCLGRRRRQTSCWPWKCSTPTVPAGSTTLDDMVQPDWTRTCKGFQLNEIQPGQPYMLRVSDDSDSPWRMVKTRTRGFWTDPDTGARVEYGGPTTPNRPSALEGRSVGRLSLRSDTLTSSGRLARVRCHGGRCHPVAARLGSSATDQTAWADPRSRETTPVRDEKPSQ